MPIVGNLSEFPLPEVLLLIGQRTGRLRLLDVPEFGVLDLDISNGAVQTMHVGSNAVFETPKMLEKLGAIVLAQSGMFEFRLGPVSVVTQALPVHDLAMKLVCHVDEQAARLRQIPSAEQRYRLVLPQPDIWMEPELNQFFQDTRYLLASGATVDTLATKFQMEPGLVQINLTHLRLLGLIEAIEETPSIRPEEETERRNELNQKNHAFRRVAQMSDRIRKLSTRLPAV